MPRFEQKPMCFYIILFIVHCVSTDITSHQKWKFISNPKCGVSNTDRIIGGKNASLGMYPWIARIGYSHYFMNYDKSQDIITYRCGGTLVNENYVITAAHCVANLPGRFKVSSIRLGEHNSETDPDCENGYCAQLVQDFHPAKIIVHKKYNKPHFKNDIALIKLNRPAIYNDYVLPICMPNGKMLTDNLTGAIAETAGWGIYDIDHPQPSVILQMIKLPVLNIDVCKKAFKHHAEVDDMQLCVGGTVGQDSCTGDSGGPLMKVSAANGSPRYYLIGIVSFGAKHCGQTSMPAVYSRITQYIDWILENI